MARRRADYIRPHTAYERLLESVVDRDGQTSCAQRPKVPERTLRSGKEHLGRQNAKGESVSTAIRKVRGPRLYLRVP